MSRFDEIKTRVFERQQAGEYELRIGVWGCGSRTGECLCLVDHPEITSEQFAEFERKIEMCLRGAGSVDYYRHDTGTIDINHNAEDPEIQKVIKAVKLVAFTYGWDVLYPEEELSGSQQ